MIRRWLCRVGVHRFRFAAFAPGLYMSSVTYVCPCGKWERWLRGFWGDHRVDSGRLAAARTLR